MNSSLKSVTRVAADPSEQSVRRALALRPPDDPASSAAVLPPPEPAPGPSWKTEGSVGLDRIAATLWRKRWTLLMSALSGLVIAIVWSFVNTPIYRARTAIRLEKPLDPYAAVASQVTSLDSVSAAPTDSYIQNEIKVLGSDSLAQRVAAHLEESIAQPLPILPSTSPLRRVLERLQHESAPPTAEELQIKSIHRAVTIRTSLKSQVVEIYFDSNDPVHAAAGADTVVSEYLAMNRDAQIKTAQDTTEWLSSQISDLKTKLDQENKQLREFASTAGLIYSPNQSALAEQRVSELETELTKASNQRATAESRYQTAANNPPESLPDEGNNTLLHTYQVNLATAERDLANLQTVYTDDNYRISDARARVTQLQNAIQRERSNILTRMRAEYDAAVRVQSSVESAYSTQTQRLQSQSADIFRYNNLKHELDTTQQLYDALLQKIKEAEIASSLQTTNVRVIDYARPPSSPYSPNLPLNMGIGTACGLLFGFTAVLMKHRECLVPQFPARRSHMVVKEIAAIPNVAASRAFPTFSQAILRTRDTTPLALAAWNGDSAFTESYSSAVASILFTPGFDRRHMAIAITSAKPQEGKTTVVANLAVKLAESFGRILLVDGDLRRPGLHKIFERGNDAGLTTILHSSAPVSTFDIAHAIQPTQVERLFLMASGPGVPSINRLLHSNRLQELMARLRHEFDYVLIDTPPTSLFSDARLIARAVDSVVLVVNAEKTSTVSFDVAYHQFIADGANVLGAIRNQSPFDPSGQAYSDYKNYGSA